jgi:hypothetical protein
MYYIHIYICIYIQHVNIKGTVQRSNGNDIETKRNDISIIGVFSVSKQNEPAYSRTLKDRSKANIFMSTLCKIEANTNWVCPKLSRIEQKRAGLVQNFPGSNKNELG